MNISQGAKGLRRELRFYKSKVERNLAAQGLSEASVKPLLEAILEPSGLLGLYGTELLLLEKALGLKSGELAVDLVGELVAVKHVPEGTGVSYGYLGQTRSAGNLGLVAVGFSDGIPRNATNTFQVEIGGKNFKSIGRIAMDQCVIELGETNPDLGAEVSFFNTNFTLVDWSNASGFTSLEILGRITSRVTRVWVA